jgi:hypothetical protein
MPVYEMCMRLSAAVSAGNDEEYKGGSGAVNVKRAEDVKIIER